MALAVAGRAHDGLGGAHLAAQQGVDQRGLAGGHGAEDDHVQRADFLHAFGLELGKLAGQLLSPRRVAHPVDELAGPLRLDSGRLHEILGGKCRTTLDFPAPADSAS